METDGTQTITKTEDGTPDYSKPNPNADPWLHQMSKKDQYDDDLLSTLSPHGNWSGVGRELQTTQKSLAEAKTKIEELSKKEGAPTDEEGIVKLMQTIKPENYDEIKNEVFRDMAKQLGFTKGQVAELQTLINTSDEKATANQAAAKEGLEGKLKEAWTPEKYDEKWKTSLNGLKSVGKDFAEMVKRTNIGNEPALFILMEKVGRYATQLGLAGSDAGPSGGIPGVLNYD